MRRWLLASGGGENHRTRLYQAVQLTSCILLDCKVCVACVKPTGANAGHSTWQAAQRARRRLHPPVPPKQHLRLVCVVPDTMVHTHSRWLGLAACLLFATNAAGLQDGLALTPPHGIELWRRFYQEQAAVKCVQAE